MQAVISVKGKKTTERENVMKMGRKELGAEEFVACVVDRLNRFFTYNLGQNC